jgi:LacI family transcriptional regulator
MRTVAAAAGVSPMTVSLALRGHASIPEPTRNRIADLAATMGYQPDPKLQQLMGYLAHSRSRPSTAARVVALCQRFHPLRHGYPEEVLEGARQRAAELGFMFNHLWLDQRTMRPSNLRRLLRTQNAECLLLLPMMDVLDLSAMADWDQYTVVSTSATVVAPRFHTVLPDQFSNTLRLCAELTPTIHGPIGLAVSEDYLFRVAKRAAAAVSWFNLDRGLPIPPTLLFKDFAVDSAALHAWLADWQPSAIITESLFFARLLLPCIPAGDGPPPTIGCLSLLNPQQQFPGIDENPRAVGASAMEILDRRYRNAEKGIPANPILTLVGGQLYPGCTTDSAASP